MVGRQKRSDMTRNSKSSQRSSNSRISPEKPVSRVLVRPTRKKTIHHHHAAMKMASTSYPSLDEEETGTFSTYYTDERHDDHYYRRQHADQRDDDIDRINNKGWSWLECAFPNQVDDDTMTIDGSITKDDQKTTRGTELNKTIDQTDKSQMVRKNHNAKGYDTQPQSTTSSAIENNQRENKSTISAKQANMKFVSSQERFTKNANKGESRTLEEPEKPAGGVWNAFIALIDPEPDPMVQVEQSFPELVNNVAPNTLEKVQETTHLDHSDDDYQTVGEIEAVKVKSPRKLPSDGHPLRSRRLVDIEASVATTKDEQLASKPRRKEIIGERNIRLSGRLATNEDAFADTKGNRLNGKCVRKESIGEMSLEVNPRLEGTETVDTFAEVQHLPRQTTAKTTYRAFRGSSNKRESVSGDSSAFANGLQKMQRNTSQEWSIGGGSLNDGDFTGPPLKEDRNNLNDASTVESETSEGQIDEMIPRKSLMKKEMSRKFKEKHNSKSDRVHDILQSMVELQPSLDIQSTQLVPYSANKSKIEDDDTNKNSRESMNRRKVLLAKELRAAISVYGRYDLRCANMCAVLGDLHMESGELDQAVRFHKDATTIYSCKLGDDHTTTINAKIRLATVLEKAGLYEQAVTAYYMVAVMNKSEKEEKDPSTDDSPVDRSTLDSIDVTLSRLVQLASDGRAEVRNSAINTIFSCIETQGSGFSALRWKSCMTEALRSVIESVSAGPSSDSYDEFSVSLNSGAKQWMATQVLVLHGLKMVLRKFFPNLLDSGKKETTTNKLSWLHNAWIRILEFAFDAAGQKGGRDTVEIRSTGMELIVLCCQLASKNGSNAESAHSRGGTPIELQSILETAPVHRPTSSLGLSPVADQIREKLFLEAFESLECLGDMVREKIKADAMRPDDTDIHFLHKLGSFLGMLYECCFLNEFYVDEAAKCCELLSRKDLRDIPNEGDLAANLCNLINAIIHASSKSWQLSKVLNQSQRSGISLLRKMAARGSSSAFSQLVTLAGHVLFLEDEEHSNWDEEIDVLSLEAASAISDEISSEHVSDECRVLVLQLSLSIFFEEYTKEDTSHTKRPSFSYKRALLIVESALESVGHLNEVDGDNEKLIRNSWSLFNKFLSMILQPASDQTNPIKINGVNEISWMIAAACSHVPKSITKDLCQVLAGGAVNTFAAVKLIGAQYHSRSDIGDTKKSSVDQSNLLELFNRCFSACCSLGPNSICLRDIASDVLSCAANADQSSPSTEKIMEATILVCNAMRKKQGTEMLIISVLPMLCKLVISGPSKVQQIAGGLLTAVDLANVLETAKSQYESAEQRATEAEQMLNKLRSNMANLQKQNEDYRQQIVALQSTRSR